MVGCWSRKDLHVLLSTSKWASAQACGAKILGCGGGCLLTALAPHSRGRWRTQGRRWHTQQTTLAPPTFPFTRCREVDAEAKRVLDAVGIGEGMLNKPVRLSFEWDDIGGGKCGIWRGASKGALVRACSTSR